MRRFTSTLLLIALPALTSACGDPADAGPVSGVLITLDTTNDTALGCYVKREGLTPNLDALALESLVFDQARTVAPMTTPSHASMLTGLYPNRHTVRVNGQRPLPESAVTLAELARENELHTAAFVSAIAVGEGQGLEQGFDLYDAPVLQDAEGGLFVGERPAAETTAAAVKWLEKRDPARPFFLWVHYFDPHTPYAPSESFLQRASQFRARFPTYLGEVAEMDQSIGELLAALDRHVPREQLLLSVVADHGESLGRHGEPTHKIYVYDATIKVPMLIRFPSGHRAGERSAEVVSVVDLFPTLVDGMKLRSQTGVDGISLFEKPVAADRGVYFESLAGYLAYGWSPLHGYADSRGSYIHGPVPEMYGPGDHVQRNNVIDSHPDLARELRAKMFQVVDLPAIPASDEDVDGELRDRIRALGYAGSSSASTPIPHPTQLAELPNPRRRIGDLNLMKEASVLVMNGKRAEAAEKFRAIIAQTPGNLEALELLGTLLYTEHRFQEVIDLFLPIRDKILYRKDCLGQLGESLKRLNRLDESLSVFMTIYEMWPSDRETLDRIIDVLDQQGHRREADEFRRKRRKM